MQIPHVDSIYIISVESSECFHIYLPTQDLLLEQPRWLTATLCTHPTAT